MIFYPLITLLIGKVLFDQEDKNNYLKRLKREKILYSTTLYSIGDAVISTDKAGNIVTFNPVAEKLTGWNESEVFGRPLEEIFNIVNEYSRLRVENPVERILNEGITIGLANHTLLISKDKKEIPIADSGAPIKDENNSITGAVLVFRDQTEEKKAKKKIEESEQRLKELNWRPNQETGNFILQQTKWLHLKARQ